MMNEHILDELEEILYISDPATHDLYYLNRRGEELLGVARWRGKKCYEVLQGLSSPCDFCTNSQLSSDTYLAWEYTNPLNNHRYLLKDKLIPWNNGKMARLEIAIDVEEMTNSDYGIMQQLRLEHVLVECIKLISSSAELSEAIGEVLRKIGEFHKGDRAYIFEISQAEQTARNTYEWCAAGIQPQKDLLQNITFEDLAVWLHIFREQKPVIIDDLEAIRQERPIEYEMLSPQDIRNLVAVPMEGEQGIMGFIGIDNPKLLPRDTAMLDSLAFFLSTEIKKRQAERQLSYLGCHDVLTGLYNRNRYIQYIKDFHSKSVDSLGVAFLDINGLKEINDRRGHASGDIVIMRTSAAVKKYFRPTDLYRIGGDEIVILCENVPKALFESKLKGIKEKLMNNRYISVSIGYVWDDGSPNIHSMIQQADAAMYKEKRQYYREEELGVGAVDARCPPLDEISYELLDDVFGELILSTYDLIFGIDFGRKMLQLVYQSSDSIFDPNMIHGEEKENDDLLRSLVYPPDREVLRRHFRGIEAWADGDETKSFQCQIRILGEDGKYYWVNLISVDNQATDENGKVRHSAFIAIKNIDEILKRYQMQRDNLTGLYTRQQFNEKADILIHTNPVNSYVVMMMDIDKFKVINDLYGMEKGNRILIDISRVIYNAMGEDDICCRMYADIFCVLSKRSTEDEVSALIETIDRGLGDPRYESMLTANYGIVRVSDRTIPTGIWCEMAGYAHKAAKAHGIHHVAYYNANIRKETLRRKQIEREMREALQRGEFAVFLQPKYNTAEKRVVGAEALARWVHPHYGILMPGEFIPLFEKNGFIIQLDLNIWEQTCQMLRRWMDEGKDVVPVSVNVSRLHFYNAQLKRQLLTLLDRYGIPGHLFHLELTESLFAQDIQSFSRITQELQAAGLVLEMDDFGSGYSSLNMLQTIHVDVLKLDCGFFSEAVISGRERIVLAHTIAMAKELDMDVVAEGVEYRQQMECLRQMGCQVIQGYYYSPPIPAREFETQILTGGHDDVE